MSDHGRPFTTFAGDRLGGPANTAIKKLFGSCDSCCGILVVDHDVLKRLHGFGRNLQSQRLNIRRGMIRRAFSSPRSRNSLMTNGEWHTVSHRFPIDHAIIPGNINNLNTRSGICNSSPLQRFQFSAHSGCARALKRSIGSAASNASRLINEFIYVHW
jgi:hypothetical protein